jgi:hypothetical protein
MLTRTRSTLALVVLAATLGACGSDSAVTPPPTPTPTGPTVLAKVSGDKQRAPVTVPLANALVGRLYVDTTHGANRNRLFSPDDVRREVNGAGDTVPVLIGIPLSHRLVNFVPVDPKCGRAFAGAAITDSLGVARDRWEGGTKAGVCVMEVRYVDSLGVAQVATSFSATFNAFPVTGFNFVNGMQDTTVAVGDSLRVAGLIANAFDQYGNANTAYLLRFRRFNNDGTLTDPGPVSAPYAVRRTGDYALTVYADSTANTLRLH